MGEKILRRQLSAIGFRLSAIGYRLGLTAESRRRIFSYMKAGYSPRSLVDKLGIKPATRIALLDAPPGYRRTLGALPPGVRVTTNVRGTLPFIQYFVTRRAVLVRRFAALK